MRVQANGIIVTAAALALALALPVVAQEKKAEKGVEKGAEKAAEKGAEKGGEAKAKAEKVSGDIGLLDNEKNYMIVVTKEGKLITLDYNAKTKATEIKETKVKMADVGLGSSAQVEYVTKGEKNFLTKMQFTPFLSEQSFSATWERAAWNASHDKASNAARGGMGFQPAGLW
jgi:hypothetical protein